METRLNKELVTHLRIKKECKGVLYSCGTIVEFDWREDVTQSLFGFFREVLYPKGYYRKGLAQSSWHLHCKDVPEGCYDLGGELYSFSSVSIFIGEKIIKTKYFSTFDESKQYCDENFPNVNLII